MYLVESCCLVCLSGQWLQYISKFYFYQLTANILNINICTTISASFFSSPLSPCTSRYNFWSFLKMVKHNISKLKAKLLAFIFLSVVWVHLFVFSCVLFMPYLHILNFLWSEPDSEQGILMFFSLYRFHHTNTFR